MGSRGKNFSPILFFSYSLSLIRQWKQHFSSYFLLFIFHLSCFPQPNRLLLWWVDGKSSAQEQDVLSVPREHETAHRHLSRGHVAKNGVCFFINIRYGRPSGPLPTLSSSALPEMALLFLPSVLLNSKARVNTNY